MGKSKGWTRGQIKGALEDRGWSLARVSRHLGHTNTRTAADVLRVRYPVVERLIADIIQVTPSTIWPDRYKHDGSPAGRGIRRPYRKFRQVGIGKSSSAA